MRLAVEEDLEPVLDLAEEAVSVVHDAPLVGRQASDELELVDGQERVGAADLGVLAAVEQLEELDDELDVADAAVAGLHLEVARRPAETVRCSIRRFRALISEISLAPR